MITPALINRLSAPVEQAASSPALPPMQRRIPGRGATNTATCPHSQAVGAGKSSISSRLEKTPALEIIMSRFSISPARACTYTLAFILALAAANSPAFFAEAHAKAVHDTQTERY